MDIRDMQAELNRQRLREREAKKEDEAKDAQAFNGAVGTEMDLVAQDLQDQRFANMRQKRMSPVPTHIANRPILTPSGILPGEEQVTTADSLGMVSPGVRKGLERVHAGAGTSATFDDWAKEKYASLPPEERLKAMRRDGLADQNANLNDRRLARNIINRDARFTPQGEGMNVAQRSDMMKKVLQGAPQLSDLQKEQQSQYALQEASRMERLRDRLKNQAMTQSMNDPRLAQGMYARSLAEAGDSPQAMARAFSSFGNDAMAAHALGLAGTQMQAQADVDAALAGRDQQPQQTALGEQLQKELAAALALPPGQREVAVQTVLRKSGTPEEAVNAASQQVILNHDAKTNPRESVAVQDEIRRRVRTGTREEFIAWAVSSMGVTPDVAANIYQQSYSNQFPFRSTVRGALGL